MLSNKHIVLVAIAALLVMACLLAPHPDAANTKAAEDLAMFIVGGVVGLLHPGLVGAGGKRDGPP